MYSHVHETIFFGEKSHKWVCEIAGGVVTSGLAIYDTMQYVLCPICTWCVGLAASMGSLLLTAGTPGRRHALPNARIMLHQPSGGTRVAVALILSARMFSLLVTYIYISLLLFSSPMMLLLFCQICTGSGHGYCYPSRRDSDPKTSD